MKTENKDSMFCIFDYGSEISDGLLEYGKRPQMKDENGNMRDVIIKQLEVIKMGNLSSFSSATFLCEYTWKEDK